MSGIIRVKKDVNYFRASNEPFNNESLSWEARGVMGYLLSKPDGWQVQDDDLIKRGPASGAKIKRILDELKEHGYLTRSRVRKQDGTFEWVTEIYESRQLNPEADSPKLKQWAQEKQANIKAKRQRAYERRKKKTIGVLYPSGNINEETIGVLTTSGSSTSGLYPHIVKTESVKTESVKTKKSKREASPTLPPPAIEAIRSITHRYPDKATWPLIVEKVGQAEQDIAFLKEVVTRWIGCGFNKLNVIGMLDFYERRELPGDDRKGYSNGHHQNGHAKPAQPTPTQATGLGEWEPGELERARRAAGL